MNEKWHGTSGGYTNHKCRCNDCRLAWNAYSRRNKAKRRSRFVDDGSIIHGKASSYQRGCNCDLCLSASARYSKQLQGKPTDSPRGDCQICKKFCEKLTWDHDHKTGQFRGWLCISCNQGLGMFDDEVTLIEKSIRYLRGDF